MGEAGASEGNVRLSGGLGLGWPAGGAIFCSEKTGWIGPEVSLEVSRRGRAPSGRFAEEIAMNDTHKHTHSRDVPDAPANAGIGKGELRGKVNFDHFGFISSMDLISGLFLEPLVNF